MKDHVHVPEESIHTKLWLWRQWSQQGLSETTFCRAGTNLFTASSAPSPPGCCSCSIPNHPLQVTQDSSSTRVVTISSVRILGWTQHEFTGKMELSHLVTSVSVLGVASVRSRSQGAAQSSHERAVPGPHTAWQPEPRPSAGSGDTQLHSPTGHGDAGPASSRIFPDPPWFIICVEKPLISLDTQGSKSQVQPPLFSEGS